MEIRPFRAYRFDAAVVGRTGDCVAPPYDVIESEQQEQLYEKSKYNIVRIIKGKTGPTDSAENNRYNRAAGYLNTWIDEGALRQDSDPTVYAYVQDFELAGAWFRRLSFVAQGRLQEFGKCVRPHEQTMNGPRQDRLELQRTTRARFGLVFMLYEDASQTAEKIVEKNITGKSLVDCTDGQNVRHRLFPVADSKDIEAIRLMMKDKVCIIADGHHRYETGLSYAKSSDNPEAWYQMMAFANTLHEGLIVLATHRMVNHLPDFDFDDLLNRLGRQFAIEQYQFGSRESARRARHKMLDGMKTEHARDRNAFGIYGGDGAFYVATLKDSAAMENAAAKMSGAWRSLDVAVLSKLVLEAALGIDEQKLAEGKHVEYVKDSGNKSKELVKLVDCGKKQVAFFMNPPKISQMQAVAEAGERMPQKSTYFYPKIHSGLVIDKL